MPAGGSCKLGQQRGCGVALILRRELGDVRLTARNSRLESGSREHRSPTGVRSGSRDRVARGVLLAARIEKIIITRRALRPLIGTCTRATMLGQSQAARTGQDAQPRR